jgi:hypothetical protein
MKKRTLGWAWIVWTGVPLLLVLIVMSRQNAEAQSVPACPTGLMTNITSGATLSGITPIQFGVPTATTSLTIDRVIYKLDGKVIGQARRNTANTNYWSMPWPTQLADPGPHQLLAHIYYNQSSQCVTPSIPINIAPSTAGVGTFAIDVQPPTWSGVTNTTIDMNVIPQSNVGMPSTEINQYAVYQWETNIGSVSPALGAARFSSGSTAGAGRVLVRAYFGGREAIREIPVQVQSQVTSPATTTTASSGGTIATTGTSPTPTEPLPGVSSGSVGSTTTNQTTPLTQEQRVQLIARQMDSQPAVLACANQNLTSARIEELKATGRRLSPEEFSRMRGCFSQTSYVIPASYAPAEPTEVKTLMPEANTARIKDMKTEVISHEEGVAKSVLRFEGQAEPNTDVLLYVFSEPLVLYAKTDGNGNWVYDLVDPMAPGEHEAYAVVEASDGTYKRSSAFSFLIETAQASDENPNGYSLSVQNVGTLNPPASKGRISLYVIGSGFVVLAVLAVGGYIVVRTMKHIPDDDSTGSGHGYGG